MKWTESKDKQRHTMARAEQSEQKGSNPHSKILQTANEDLKQK